MGGAACTLLAQRVMELHLGQSGERAAAPWVQRWRRQTWQRRQRGRRWRRRRRSSACRRTCAQTQCGRPAPPRGHPGTARHGSRAAVAGGGADGWRPEDHAQRCVVPDFPRQAPHLQSLRFKQNDAGPDLGARRKAELGARQHQVAQAVHALVLRRLARQLQGVGVKAWSLRVAVAADAARPAARRGSHLAVAQREQEHARPAAAEAGA